jgi:hypothetical protein
MFIQDQFKYRLSVYSTLAILYWQMSLHSMSGRKLRGTDYVIYQEK